MEIKRDLFFRYKFHHLFLPGLQRVRTYISIHIAVPFISVVTKVELLSFPNITEKEEDQILELLQNFSVIPLDDEITCESIKVRKKFRLKVPDAIIAASALIHKGTLVTRNEKEFKKVKELKILNPFR